MSNKSKKRREYLHRQEEVAPVTNETEAPEAVEALEIIEVRSEPEAVEARFTEQGLAQAKALAEEYVITLGKIADHCVGLGAVDGKITYLHVAELEAEWDKADKGPGLLERIRAALTKERHLPKLPRWAPITGIVAMALILFAILMVSAFHPRGRIRLALANRVAQQAEPTAVPTLVITVATMTPTPAPTKVAPTKEPTVKPAVTVTVPITPTVQAVVPVTPTMGFTVTAGITPTIPVTPTAATTTTAPVTPTKVVVVGRVKDQNGGQVGGALVAIGNMGTQTFSDGTFELPNTAEAESYTLAIRFAETDHEVVREPVGKLTVPGKKADVGEISITVPEPEIEVTTPVTPTTPVTSTVVVTPTMGITVTIENAPEELTLLYLVREDEIVADAVVSDDGTFLFEGVPDGVYGLQLESLITPITVKVDGGEIEPLSLHKVVEGETLWEDVFGVKTWEDYVKIAEELGLDYRVDDKGTPDDTSDDLLVVYVQPGQVFDLDWAPST